MNVRGIYLCFVCLKEKKIKYQNIRYQSYKYQSIKIIYDQIVNQLPFHVTFFCFGEEEEESFSNVALLHSLTVSPALKKR